MRVSVLKGDPSYTADAYWYEAYLDGEKLSHCVTADEERGEAVVQVLDGQGRPKLNAALGIVETQLVRGRVTVERRARP